MLRINLYNYRYQELYYKKLRLYLLLLLSIFSALCFNLFSYSYYQLQIMYQQERNAFLIGELNLLDSKIKPLDSFNQKVNFINRRIKLLQKVEAKRANLLAFLQQINKITPAQIYYSQINWQAQQVDLIGVTNSPLYLANLLDKLGDKNSIFLAAVLKANNSSDGIQHNFAISAAIKPDLAAEHDGSN